MIHKTILYLDDEKNNLIAFKASYREHFKIFTATTAKEAFEILEKHPIEIVLSDQRMPEMDGVEFLSIVHEKYPWTVRMIVTAYSDLDALIEAVNKGKIYYFIKKPWDTHQVKLVLDKVFETLELKDKNEELVRENVKAQLNNLKTQLKPHFLFNALATLSSMLDQDVDLAKDFVHRLSTLYRQLLELNKKDTVRVQDELDCAENYIFLQQVKFGDKLQYAKTNNTSSNQKRLVSSSVLTLVENAIKHNIISEEEPLKIEMEINEEWLIVRNNFNPRTDVISSKTGLSNLSSRSQLLCGKDPVVKQNSDSFEVHIPLIEYF